jgi:hypothetical protein
MKTSGVAKRGCENDDDESSELEVQRNVTLAVRFTKTAKLHAGISEKSGPHLSRESVWKEAGFEAYFRNSQINKNSDDKRHQGG